jgi:hypothetical protein
MRELSLVFTGLWFGSIRLPSEKYKIISWKKKEFEDLEDLVISFRLYFVIAGTAYVSLPCTIYSYKYIWCWLSKKRLIQTSVVLSGADETKSCTAHIFPTAFTWSRYTC